MLCPLISLFRGNAGLNNASPLISGQILVRVVVAAAISADLGQEGIITVAAIPVAIRKVAAAVPATPIREIAKITMLVAAKTAQAMRAVKTEVVAKIAAELETEAIRIGVAGGKSLGMDIN